MGRGSRVRSPPEADTFTAVPREFVLVRYDFNRLAVYLSFRTPIEGKLPPSPPPSGGATVSDSQYFPRSSITVHVCCWKDRPRNARL